MLLSPATLPAILPSFPKVNAVTQSGPTEWVPYGPFVDNLLITVYGDFQVMFNAFTSGDVDLTDWPVNDVDEVAFGQNPDFFLTAGQAEFGIFQVDFNHHAPWMGKPSQEAKSAAVLGLKPGLSFGAGNPRDCTGLTTLIVRHIDGEAKAKQGIQSKQSDLSDKNGVTAAGLTATEKSKSSPVDAEYILCGGALSAAAFVVTSAAVFCHPPVAQAALAAGTVRTIEINVEPCDGVGTRQATTIGVDIREAIAHLIDKPDFTNVAALGGRADYLDFQAPTGQGVDVGAGPSRVPFDIGDGEHGLIHECLDHLWRTPCDAANPPVSAYNLAADSLANPRNAFADRGYPGVDDLRAACDHLVEAGFAISPAGASCLDVANNAAAGGAGAHLVPTGTVKFFIRTHPPRKAFGQNILDALNALFGTPAGGTILYGPSVSPRYFTIGEVADTIFRTEPDRDDWEMYSGGWILGSNPDHLYALYHSKFASSVCGGKKSTFAQNYHFYCNQEFDTYASLGNFAVDQSTAGVFFASAAMVAHENVMTIPVYSGAGLKFVALNGWDGLVSVLGHGFQTGFWSEFNMRCKQKADGTGPVPPTNPLYAQGGPGGNCDVIRRGFSQETRKMSMFQAQTFWEFEVLVKIYDSMLASNPLTAGAGLQLIDWMTTKHTTSVAGGAGAAFTSSSGIITPLPGGGVRTQTWTLRNDLKFHDGVPVTANDVCFSIIAYRDVPSANLQPSVATVTNCAVSADKKTAVVTLSPAGAFDELNIGGLPILPWHTWGPICNWPNKTPYPGLVALQGSQCANPAFDPMQAGIMNGSGPWQCLHIQTGAVGGTCTQTAAGAPGTQEVAVGGRILLTGYEGYMRAAPNLQDLQGSASNLQQISWADGDDSGKVDILDVATAALNFGQNAPYWDHDLFGVTDAQVDIGEIATIAFYFDHGITSPLSPGALTGMGSVDPYKFVTPHYIGIYEGARSVAGNFIVSYDITFAAKPIQPANWHLRVVSEIPGVLDVKIPAVADPTDPEGLLFTMTPKMPPGHYFIFLLLTQPDIGFNQQYLMVIEIKQR